MQTSFLKKVLPLLLLIVTTYVLHEALFHFFKIDTTAFVYSLKGLYALFTLFTILIVFILNLVKRKSFDNVGMSFLLATTLKMLFCYLILRPVLNTATQQIAIEKINFFFLFIYFLLIETLFTIRLVNDK